MIALGESIVIIGASLTGLRDLKLGELVAYLLAFVTTVSLWWSTSIAARLMPLGHWRLHKIPVAWPGRPFTGRRCRWSPG